MGKPAKDKTSIDGLEVLLFIIKLPVLLLKYLFSGFFLSICFFIYLFVSIIQYTIKYFLWGYITVSFVFYKILTSPVWVFCKIFHIKRKRDKHSEELLKRKADKAEAIRRMKEAKALEKQHKILLKQEAKEKKFIKQQEEKHRRESEILNDKNTYINKNVKVEKHDTNYYLNKIFNAFAKLPETIKNGFKNIYQNTTVYKNKKNKEKITKEALLLNFEGDDANKSEVKVVYEYVAKDPNGKTVKGYFEAFSKVEVHSFLLSEGYEVYSIKTSKLIQFLHGGTGKTSTVRVKTKDLIFFLTQLSTYIKAGIPLVEALKILTRQFKDKKYKRLFEAIMYDLTMGDNFSVALNKQGEAFPRLLTNMIEASELTGELPEALDDMADYYTQTEATKKQMISALTYPAIVLVLAVGVMTFIMIYVIPKFVAIYETMDNAQIPGFTKFIINLSDFLKSNLVWLLLGIVGVALLIRYLYKNVKVLRIGMQWMAMHTPGMKDIIIYNEVTMFTKTFASLLKHNVFITKSMDILNKISNNEIYKGMILQTINNLAEGEKISLAFKDQWAFPIPAYEMIVTGEKTGQLAEMMQKVSEYYQDLHKNAVTKLKAFIEPVLIVGLTGCVGVVVLAVVVPMFNLYQQIQGQ